MAAFVAPGGVASFGSILEDAPTTRTDVILQSVTPLGVHGVIVDRIVASGAARSFAMVGAARGFPPAELAGGFNPVAGTVVSPGKRGVALTFAVRRDDPGRGFIAGFAVTYAADGVVHTQRFHQGMTVCAVANVDLNKPLPASYSCDDPTGAERELTP